MGTEEDYKKLKPMMPTSIKKEYKQLFIRLFRAEGLPKMDSMFGSIDAYAKMEIGKYKLKTRVVKMENNMVDWM